MITVIGTEELKPFSNLSTKWLKEAEFSNFIWVIHIDLELDGADNCFPLMAHVAYGNKIVQGVTAQGIWGKGEVEVRTVTLSPVVHNQAGDDAFDEAIREADSALEDLI